MCSTSRKIILIIIKFNEMNALVLTDECTPRDVPPDVRDIENNSSTSGSKSGPDVPTVAINLNDEYLTTGIPGRTLWPESGKAVGPEVGPSTEKDVRSIFRESKTFKNYFYSNSTDEVMNLFLDVHTIFLDLSEADEWELFNEWMLNRFILERKNKKLQEIQDVLSDMINQDFYTSKTKERLRNMSPKDAIDYMAKNINTCFEMNVLEPKLQRYFRYTKALNVMIEIESSEAIENTPNNSKGEGRWRGKPL
jgi:hypothetical protein